MTSSLGNTNRYLKLLTRARVQRTSTLIIIVVLFIVVGATSFYLLQSYFFSTSVSISFALPGWLFPVYDKGSIVDAVFVNLHPYITDPDFKRRWSGPDLKYIYSQSELENLTELDSIIPPLDIQPFVDENQIRKIVKDLLRQENASIDAISDPLLIYGINGPYYYSICTRSGKNITIYTISAKTGKLESIAPSKFIVPFMSKDQARIEAEFYLKKNEINGDLKDGYYVVYSFPKGARASNNDFAIITCFCEGGEIS